MKILNKSILALGLVAMFGFTSCVDDLDQMPKESTTLTSEKFSEDPEGYMNQVLAECYLSFSTTGIGGAGGSANIQGFDGGMGTFQRAVFNLNEIPTDEADWLSTSDSHMQASVQFCVFPANNSAIYGTYSRLTINASICNEFIRTVQNGKFGLPEELKAKAENYCNQARVLRSLAYFYLIDMFGNVPYADETLPAGGVPEQYTRAEAYQKVVADLEAAAAYFDANDTPAYGYVGRDAADALLVKFYLNAGVFTGTPAYDKCYAKCQEIINRHKGGGFNGSGLAKSYTALFAANNEKYVAGGANKDENEILWTIPFDAENLTAYAGTSFLINAWITNATADSDWQIQCNEYNSSEGWKCILARKQFVEKFQWNDDGTSPDLRTALWKTSAHGFNIENTGLTQADYGNGYVAVKYTNYAYDNDGNIDLENSPVAAGFSNADYAVIRLAEIYLSAAECYVVGGVGEAQTALDYVNYIRNRAGLESWQLANLTANNLLDERCRELYQENCRRTDLVRFGKFTGGSYIWNFKGGVKNGTSIADYLNLYPIPTTVVALAGYKQNPGY